MNWSTSSTYSPTAVKNLLVATATGTNATDGTLPDSVTPPKQEEHDVVVPLVLWAEPPRVEVSCLQVFYLPTPSVDTPTPVTTTTSSSSGSSRPPRGLGSGVGTNEWPSLASVLQQWRQIQSQDNQRQGQRQPQRPGSGDDGQPKRRDLAQLRRVLQAYGQSIASAVVGTTAEEGERGHENQHQDQQHRPHELKEAWLDHEDEDEGRYQVNVFAGTMDGTILHWIIERDIVLQVNMLVHPHAATTYSEELERASHNGTNGGGGSQSPLGMSPIQSVVSGIDEWGQRNLVSVTRDGAVARWELPSGACSRADLTLARQLAPIQGMKMICNHRFAMVYGEQSRMMVLDTWKMTLTFCADTAQEQMRRSVASVELKMAPFRGGSRPMPQASPSRQQHRSPTRASAVTLPPSASSSSLPPPIVIPPPRNTLSPSISPSLPTQSSLYSSSSRQVWDTLVLSLGSEGLVKCFLWSQPRGSSSSSVTGSYRWVQKSCWVVSWAEEADDITCSQSTSLKDGDNMHPQTALMRSINSSYFPRALHVSEDALLLLLVWDTRWAVIKREWLCDLSSDSSSKDSSYGPRSKPEAAIDRRIGSCRIHPSVYLAQDRATRHHHATNVRWDDGAFVGDHEVVLWTNTGHVFRFSTQENGTSEEMVGTTTTRATEGKLFMFTKDHDQLVPRSYQESFRAVHTAERIAFLDQCDCCTIRTQAEAARFQTEQLRQDIATMERTTRHGYTTCASPSEVTSLLATSPMASSMALTSAEPMIRLVHVCANGSVGCWNIRTPTYASSPLRTAREQLLNGASISALENGTYYERVRFHALSDGFVKDPSSAAYLASSSRRGIFSARLTHLVLGREDARSSSCFNDPLRHKRARRRRGTSGASATHDSYHHTTASSASNAPAYTTADAAHTMHHAFSPTEDLSSQYLMHVPVLASARNDGAIEFFLLGSQRTSSLGDDPSRVHVRCHHGSVTAIAHCHWTMPYLEKETSRPAPPSVTSSRSGSSKEIVKENVNVSVRRAHAWKQGMPVDDLSLATNKNPFHRTRFPPATQRRTTGVRHLDIHAAPSLDPSVPATEALSGVTDSYNNTPSVSFMVFTGGVDGVLAVTELTLLAGSHTFIVEARLHQQLKNHVGAIKEVLISPMMREHSMCPERYVATIGEDNSVNIYVPVYLYNPLNQGPLRQEHAFQGRCGIQWECIMQFSEHTDAVVGLEWQTDRGMILVECADHMVYVWNLDTGIMERAIPSSLMYERGGDGDGDATEDGEGVNPSDHRSVEWTRLGRSSDSAMHLLKLNVSKGAELIKCNWKMYYYSLLNTESPSPKVVAQARNKVNNDDVSDDGQGTAYSSSAHTSRSVYATGSIEMVLFSFLLSWGATREVDQVCRDLLGLHPPDTLFSCVLMDASSRALTIPIPWKSIYTPLSSSTHSSALNPFARKWQHSSALSANLALGIVSLCMNLMEHKYTSLTVSNDVSSTLPSSPSNKEEFQVLWSQLITQHSVALSDYVPFCKDVSLDHLAKYGFHPSEYTQLAARTLLNGAIKRLTASSRSTFCAEYSAKLHCEIVRLETETGGKLNGSSTVNSIPAARIVSELGALVLVLSMIGTCFPGEISPASAREVCDLLVLLLQAPAHHIASVAAELLTKGLMLFRPHLVDLSSLISQLLLLSMHDKLMQRQNRKPVDGSLGGMTNGPHGTHAALSLLVELGAYETAFVLPVLQHEMNSADRPHEFRECILLYLTELINTHYLLMFRHLPAVVDTIMCCLDPTKAERRRRCLELSTVCLHNLVRRFPMVDFHKETQRLALGTMEAVILIYDLRTATKWRVLDGHTAAISAVGFRHDGQMIVSYAAREGSVRWWNSGNAGIFGGMLKMQQSCVKEHKLAVLTSVASAPSVSGGASGDLKQVIQTCRIQFVVLKEAPSTAAVSAHTVGSTTKERKVLRLTREDASQVQFLM